MCALAGRWGQHLTGYHPLSFCFSGTELLGFSLFKEAIRRLAVWVWKELLENCFPLFRWSGCRNTTSTVLALLVTSYLAVLLTFRWLWVFIIDEEWSWHTATSLLCVLDLGIVFSNFAVTLPFEALPVCFWWQEQGKSILSYTLRWNSIIPPWLVLHLF